MGPVASVLLREPLTDEQLSTLRGWLDANGCWVTARATGGGLLDYDLSIAEQTFPDLIDLHREGPRPFSFSDEEPITYEEEQDSWQSCLGYMPQGGFHISAGCNQPIDHLILGRLALYWARELGGVIDMGGAVTPGLPLPPGRHRLDDGHIWGWTIDEVRAFLSTMPGKTFEHWYEVTPTRRFVSHSVDTDFLEAWLKHPQFRMIK